MKDVLGNTVNKDDMVVYADYQGFFHTGKVVDIIDNYIIMKKNGRVIARESGCFVRIRGSKLRVGDRVAYIDILNRMQVGEITDIDGDRLKINNSFFTDRECVARL